MPRHTQAAGECEKCGEGTINCSHNHFADETQTIDTWEHRCTSCAYRETQAFRVDAENPQPEGDPMICPLCGRRGQIQA
ncbi:MAG: hypothetical protein MPJ50_01200 [Pirellulales bacterium]|nr:hypothetical protein [Pirellulales bacterium]